MPLFSVVHDINTYRTYKLEMKLNLNPSKQMQDVIF